MKSMEILMVDKTYQIDFPNIKMNTVPCIEAVDFIMKCIIDFKPEIIITHHPADMNNDHAITSENVQYCVQMIRNEMYSVKLKKIMFACSAASEWKIASLKQSFVPNLYVDIGEAGMNAKIQAMTAYKNIIRPYPHPSNPRVYKGLANFRGMQSGGKYVEAFECVTMKI